MEERTEERTETFVRCVYATKNLYIATGAHSKLTASPDSIIIYRTHPTKFS
jgi:hypothetical protein